MRVFATTDRNGQLYLSLLIQRDNAFQLSTPQLLVETSCTKSPYLLVPGYLVNIQTSNINQLISAVLSLSSRHNQTHELPKILNFNSPLRSILQESDITNRSSIKSTHTNPNLVASKHSNEKEIEYKLVQLTRPEVTFLIGKNGRKIEDIRKRSKANVKVVPIDSEMNRNLNLRSKNVIQFLRISGTKKQIQDALLIIESDVYQFRNGGITSY